ncbi:recombinase family protein [Bradyrhizobium sp. LB12.1]|uniref:recombinase family protein n=1 Tax=Bradyrhizobium sp. LB12.1 TaxID=3156327 RepID=UPI003391017F
MASSGKHVAYCRVSTARQGKSGLGLEAQRQAVTDYLNGGDWKIVGEFTEIESGTKKKTLKRPELAKALALSRLHGAKLVIARLDRLSRDPVFLLNLKDAGVEFVAVDNPHMNRLTVGVMALVAEDEAIKASERTKAALKAAKKRGTVLGGFRGKVPTAKHRSMSAAALERKANDRAADIAPTIAELQAAGATSLRAIAAGLNEKGIPTARGEGAWSATQVQRVMARLPS